MSNISLEASIRTCKIDTAWAERVQSDRFFNPNHMVCPVWNGMDSVGRRVCPDSFNTKSAGCNSAEDRLLVENDQRPQYFEYINLSANGVRGDIYADTSMCGDVGAANSAIRKGYKYHGSFGQDWKANTYPACGVSPYSEAMAQESYDRRQQQFEEVASQSQCNRKMAGV